MGNGEAPGIDSTWTWRRGPVRLDGDALRFDTAALEPYAAGEETRLLWALADVRDDAQALAFARRFGPLRAPGPGGREALADWHLEVGLLHGALHLQADISPTRLADPGGAAALRARWQDAMPDARVPRSDRALVFEAAGAVVEALDRGLAETTVRVDPTGGTMRVVLVPRSLIGLAYLQLARLVTADDRVRRCLECGRVFPVQDRRQRFCSERHASRARLRRFREARRQGTFENEDEASGSTG